MAVMQVLSCEVSVECGSAGLGGQPNQGIDLVGPDGTTPDSRQQRRKHPTKTRRNPARRPSRGQTILKAVGTT